MTRPINLKQLRLTRTYEGSGSVAELQEDLAHIRGLDRDSQRLGTQLGWAAPGVLVASLLLAIAINDRASVVVLGVGVVGLIALLVARGHYLRTDFEDRRYELAEGLLRTLEVSPSAPLRMGLLLGPDRLVQTIGSTKKYQTPWLYLEGTLADGLGFRLARTSFKTVSYSTRYSGRTRITTTSTSGAFTDELTLRYQPGTFPQLVAAGDGIRGHLQLGQVAKLEQLENQDGVLSARIRCSFKWDAGPAGAAGGALNAVALAAMLFGKLYDLLQRPPPVNMARAQALPPPRAIGVERDPKTQAMIWIPRVLATILTLLTLMSASRSAATVQRSSDVVVIDSSSSPRDVRQAKRLNKIRERRASRATSSMLTTLFFGLFAGGAIAASVVTTRRFSKKKASGAAGSQQVNPVGAPQHAVAQHAVVPQGAQQHGAPPRFG